ncbi:hypothetical protein [Flavobacterium sp. DSP2-3-1]|uniref:hypothetical protein n=1 Tax=Flavobacterium sp. DSP2-3-1 TaxID=2804620 RepID=UPI003CE6B960
MEKYIVLLKKTFLISGSLSILLALVDYYFNLMHFDTKGYFGAFQFLLFSIFILSLYIFFILSDIKKEKFVFLRYFNYTLILVSFSFFIIWGVIYPDPLAFLYPAYFGILNVFNLIVMTIIYQIKRTGGDSIFKEWLYFFGLIAVFVIYIVIMSLIKF